MQCYIYYLLDKLDQSLENKPNKSEHSKKNSYDFSSSSSSASPQRIYNHYRNRKKLLNSLNKDESQEDSVENDSDLDFALGNFKNHHDEDILYQLLKSIYELCIEVPVE